MKRNLLESVRLIPYAPNDTVNRLGALSAVFAISALGAAPGAIAKVTVAHCETESGTYTDVVDKRIFLNSTVVEKDGNGNFVRSNVFIPIEAGDLVNVDIDLVGCKEFVKINVEYVDDSGAAVTATTEYALCLGDFTVNPPA